MRRKYVKHRIDSKGWTRWIRPIMKGYRLNCCECNLVHEMEFRIHKGRPEFRARVDIKETDLRRKEK